MADSRTQTAGKKKAIVYRGEIAVGRKVVEPTSSKKPKYPWPGKPLKRVSKKYPS